MHEFHTYKLSEVCTKIGSGATPRGGKETYLHHSDIFLIRSQNVLDFSFSLDGGAFISNEQARLLDGVKVHKNDILINITGDSVARVCSVPDYIKEARVNQHVAILRSNPLLLSSHFLKYYLLQPQIKSLLVTLSSAGATRKALTKSMLEEFTVDIPSLILQHRIADILGALDDKIELNRQMNQTLEQMAQALYRHYFINDIDPENLPKGWKVEPLSQIAEFLNGVALQKYPSRTGEPVLPAIKIKEMSSGITSATDLCSDNIPEKYLVNDGDLLFSWSGTLDVVFWSYGLGALNQHLFKVSSVRFPKWFVYQWILFYLEEFRDIAASKATTMGHIQRHHLDEALVWYPTKPQFEKINTQIAPLVDIIIQNRVESVNLTKIRDTLLPKLISGELIPSDLTTIEQAL
jgi:type I restriction enzyme S subunit